MTTCGTRNRRRADERRLRLFPLSHPFFGHFVPSIFIARSDSCCQTPPSSKSWLLAVHCSFSLVSSPSGACSGRYSSRCLWEQRTLPSQASLLEVALGSPSPNRRPSQGLFNSRTAVSLPYTLGSALSLWVTLDRRLNASPPFDRQSDSARRYSLPSKSNLCKRSTGGTPFAKHKPCQSVLEYQNTLSVVFLCHRARRDQSLSFGSSSSSHFAIHSRGSIPSLS